MKKKIIFVAICAVLLMIFTSISYGGGNGKYILLAHPWDHLLVMRITGDIPLLLVNVIRVDVNQSIPSNLSEGNAVSNFTKLEVSKKTWQSNPKNTCK